MSTSNLDTLSEKCSTKATLDGTDEASSSVLLTNIKEKMFVPQSVVTESCSESSSEIGEDEVCRNGGYTHPSFELDHDPKKQDVYADVREKMEMLARADREKHFHLSKNKEESHKNEELQMPFFSAFMTYLTYIVVIITGHTRDLASKIFRRGRYRPTASYPSDDSTTYAPLLKNWENFFTRRMYHRIQDCLNRPIASNPGSFISILERVSEDGFKTMEIFTDKTEEKGFSRDEFLKGEYATQTDDRIIRKCINLGSYNYLGFGDDWNETCASTVLPTLERNPLSCTSPRIEAGNTTTHEKLEELLCDFLDKESVFVHSMGYNTNFSTIPALVGKGDLIISDELNHKSICSGALSSGANIRVFKHNDEHHLEEIIKDAIVMGRPRTRRPFNKILVIVEGIYSMEGEYCNLGPINRICKKYGVYLYLDEAHSIGAMGPTGRGCCEYWGVTDVDIMMGTFSKSFGGMGGYVAGKKEIIDCVRVHCNGSLYHNSLSPPVCQQILSSLEIIMGKDGTTIGKQKIDALRDNSNYFRMRLREMNMHVLGNYDSPVIPLMIYHPCKIPSFSRECYKRGIAAVVVGFPAVPLMAMRARFCISAAHKREDLDRVLNDLEEICKIIKLDYKVSTFA